MYSFYGFRTLAIANLVLENMPYVSQGLLTKALDVTAARDTEGNDAKEVTFSHICILGET